MNKYLLALACGDSYGSAYEYEGLCGVKFNVRSLPNKPLSPNITDDTKMAKILLDHYLKHNTLYETKLFYAYQEWALKDGLEDGIGIHTHNVLVKESNDRNSQGNGALMRNIPFALQLIEDGCSFEEAVDLMNQDSFLTHKNDIIAITNYFALDLALHGVEMLQKSIYEPLLKQLHLGDTAWVIHTLYIVVEAMKKELNYLDGFKYITSHGGDTDTNCAIFAAIRSGKHHIKDELNVYKFIDMGDFKLLEEY